MEEYLFLTAIFEINRETKRVDREIEKEKDQDVLKQMEDYRKRMYDQKDNAMHMLIYALDVEIDRHVYKMGSYWLLSIAGFEYHMKYIQIPRLKNKNRIKVETRAYGSVKELGVGKALQVISEFRNRYKDKQDFNEFMEKFDFYKEKDVRPYKV